MGDGSELLGGYKVGQISAFLEPKSSEKRKKDEENTRPLFLCNSFQQPHFVPVAVKKSKKDPDLRDEKKTEDTENASEGAKRRHSLKDDKSYFKTRKEHKMPVKRSAQDDPERLSRTIFVGNLPITTSRKDLKKLFKKYGDIESTRLRSVAIPDLKTSKKVAALKKQFNPNRSNVNGYIVFKQEASAGEALASDGTKIGDLHIRVDRVDGSGKQYDHKRSIFLGNLVFDVKEEAVSDFFSVCGEVQSVCMIRDSSTGIGKGFGYVLFKESSSVSLALKMNNSEFCGRKIRIQQSQDKPKMSEGGSRKKGQNPKNFSGLQAKQKGYQRRKALKQQKSFGLFRKKQSKSNKQTEGTSLYAKKKQ